ncbi:MAG: GAF domain-containing protein [Chloroflexota bacterium]|nr:GAF domain-containing protein [Chloroflexota bacterium]
MDGTTDRPRVLCVDDTSEVRTLVRRLLSHRYEIVEADDGLRGIEVARDAQPDIVLLDMHMPGLTGYEVATRLKSLLPDVPIVALTADVTSNIRERVLAAGCDGYLYKPIDPDAFEDQVQAYLDGAREELDDDSYRRNYQQMLVARLEDKVRELTRTLQRNADLNEQNVQLLEQARRRVRLLGAGAKVGRSIASILDLDALLNTTVDVICDEFGFYYAGVFLIDETGEWAVLRAGRGEAGATMVAAGHKLKVDGHSMVGAATGRRKARIALDVGEEPVHFKNPYLPHTRSEMALPLVAGNEVIGALTVQSVEEAAFGDDDVTALQSMADQLAIAIHNARLHLQNQRLLAQAERNARLLVAAAQVGQDVTSILDMDELLNRTVDIICDAYGFYYAGVFLIDETSEWAVLRAGRGEAGAAMIAKEHKLKVGGLSMIGTAIQQRKARIALDVGEEPVHFKNPHLPHTRSEMALPLVAGNEVIGALTVQSVEEAAFGDDDATALQSMADQLAVAINNAQLLKELETAHGELVQAKTFEAIATATGEAIHWVGNKAAPIPGSVARITEDFVRYMAMANALVAEAPSGLREHKFARLLSEAAEEISSRGNFLDGVLSEMDDRSLKRLRKMLTVESVFEDLEIIEGSARAILNIKEDLIGPARKRKPTLVSLEELLTGTIASMGIPEDVVRTLFSADLPPVQADKSQLERVFINLIKNGMEAMYQIENQRLFLWARPADDPGFVVVDVTDSGPGIPPEIMDKIWMAFYTTKGNRGGTGLGLAACAQIVGQLGGKITVESDVGVGTTFSVLLPAAAENNVEGKA